jgi:hypothetical protein
VLVERTVFTETAIPGEAHAAVLAVIIPIFVAENQLTPGADAEQALAELFAPQFIGEIAPPPAT